MGDLAPVIDLAKARNRRDRRALQRMGAGFGRRLGAPHRTSELYASKRTSIELRRAADRAKIGRTFRDVA